jgi:hypothetical protein
MWEAGSSSALINEGIYIYPSWVSPTLAYAVTMHSRQNILEYWLVNPNIPEDVTSFIIDTMPD